MKNLGVFDKTTQKTGKWIEAVAHGMGSTDMERSFHVLRSVLHAIRDRLPANEAVHLGAQMPMLVRGFYYEGWHPAVICRLFSTMSRAKCRSSMRHSGSVPRKPCSTS
jgi:uncharacterized protein (DUF2267 family)